MAEKEFDHADPFTLNGTVLTLPPEEAKAAEEEMAACFIEEYLRLGYTEEKILEFFNSPFYRGTFEIRKTRGEKFVREMIRRIASIGGPPTSTTTETPAASEPDEEFEEMEDSDPTDGGGHTCTCGKKENESDG